MRSVIDTTHCNVAIKTCPLEVETSWNLLWMRTDIEIWVTHVTHLRHAFFGDNLQKKTKGVKETSKIGSQMTQSGTESKLQRTTTLLQ